MAHAGWVVSLEQAMKVWAKTWAENAADLIDSPADFASGFVCGVGFLAVVNVGVFWLDYYLQQRPF